MSGVTSDAARTITLAPPRLPPPRLPSRVSPSCRSFMLWESAFSSSPDFGLAPIELTVEFDTGESITQADSEIGIGDSHNKDQLNLKNEEHMKRFLQNIGTPDTHTQAQAQARTQAPA